MPVEYTKITGENQIIGLWKLEDEKKDLSPDILSSSQAAIKGYRKSHSEACMSLIQVMTGWESVMVLKNENGKPYLKNSSSKISFSHSGDYAAAIYNTRDEVGIDIQEIKDKILLIANKFTNKEEFEYITISDQIKMLHVIWGAKESMFKKYGKGNVLFKEHIFVHPFQLQQSDYITVSFKKYKEEETCTFKYQFYDNYCLVHSACHL